MHPVTEKVLVENEESGVAISELPHGYEGPCCVHVEGRSKSEIGFSCVREAISAAKFAVGELGGFYRAVVRPGAASQDRTYATWQDWAFS